MQEEKNIDVKGTLEKFIKADEPEISQEEAINNFQEKDLLNEIKKNAKFSSDDDEQNSEEQEHLERIKKELLASLERVKLLERQIYGDKQQNEEKNRLKVSNEQLHIKEQYKSEQPVKKKIQSQEQESKDRE